MVVGRNSGWPRHVPVVNGKPDEKSLQAARSFDAVNFARPTKAGAFFTVGFIDVTCPPTSGYAAYNAVTGEKEMVHSFRTGHIATPEGDAAAKAAILAHVRSSKSDE